MTKNDGFRAMMVAVYYNQYYCGLASVTNTGSGNSAGQTGFAASETATATVAAAAASHSLGSTSK